MNRVTYLGELEHMLLWVVLRLKNKAYGLAVRDELERRTGRSVARGAVYITLDRLVQKGYLTSRLGASSTARAGRAKRFFTITSEGRAAVRSSRQALERLWRGLGATMEES